MPRARKDGTPAAAPVAKNHPAIDFTQLTATVVRDPNVMRVFKRTKGERSAEQRQVDTLVMTAHKNWLEAGKPTVWAQIPGLYLKVPEAQFEALQARLRSSGAYLDLAIRFGSRQNSDGYAEVVMVVKDKPGVTETSKDNGDDDSEPDAESVGAESDENSSDESESAQ